MYSFYYLVDIHSHMLPNKDYDFILIAFDEMQAGFGRTGELFGYMHYEIEPDLLCCGKGASSGFPLALVLGSAERNSSI